MADMVNVLIDGKPIAVEKGTLVIEAARRLGVMVPHFCYHPKLTYDANCRMCLVEIEKIPKLQTSCSTVCTEGMVVRTNTPVVNEAHQSVLEFILANHPLDCPICDQGGRCDLQDFSHEYTPTTSVFSDTKRVYQKEFFSPLTEIVHFAGHQLDCEFCGGCVQICPVGAITSRLSMYEFRPWMMKRADSTCGYCGDGCSLILQTRDQKVVEVMSAYGEGRNNGDLCARGFFGYQYVTHQDRLASPLIRQADGQLRPATWDEALPALAERLTQVKLMHGADAIGGLISARCTN